METSKFRGFGGIGGLRSRGRGDVPGGSSLPCLVCIVTRTGDVNDGFGITESRGGSFYCWRLRAWISSLVDPVAVISMPFCAFVELWIELDIATPNVQ
jgi:hypothetical protein